MLDADLKEKIISEAKIVLAEIGMDIAVEETKQILADHGADVDNPDGRVRIGDSMVETALDSAPLSFSLYDVLGEETHTFEGQRTHFTPGSAAINILDRDSGEIRPAMTADLVALAKLVSRLPRYDAQATSEVIRDLLLAVRGTAENLAAKPVGMLTCCPTAPLRWTDEGSHNLMDCARMRIPVEIIPVPLTGFMAPVTLVGTLIQHTAEVLSGVVIAQLVQPGTPVLFGGSPAIFDVRYSTTPMGAIETTMLTCGAAEVGRHLGLPTQGYISLSDSKALDAQAGLETGIGALMAALTGIDNVSGPGMLDFESAQSLEKLVVDHETCLMTDRVRAGFEPREDFPSKALFEELLAEKHLMIADHTRRHLRSELTFPGPVIDRTSRQRWLEEGSKTLAENVATEVDRILAEFTPSRIGDDVKKNLQEVMTAAANAAGMDTLPDRS
jgi:trimethylamine--corrinoid protein Co-methyltransferase